MNADGEALSLTGERSALSSKAGIMGNGDENEDWLPKRELVGYHKYPDGTQIWPSYDYNTIGKWWVPALGYPIQYFDTPRDAARALLQEGLGGLNHDN